MQVNGEFCEGTSTKRPANPVALVEEPVVVTGTPKAGDLAWIMQSAPSGRTA